MEDLDKELIKLKNLYNEARVELEEWRVNLRGHLPTSYVSSVFKRLGEQSEIIAKGLADEIERDQVKSSYRFSPNGKPLASDVIKNHKLNLDDFQATDVIGGTTTGEFRVNMLTLHRFDKPDEIEREESGKQYKCYIRNCECVRPGIIIYKGIPVCRWCRNPYANTSYVDYLDSHFQHIKSDEIEAEEKEKRIEDIGATLDFLQCSCGRYFKCVTDEDKQKLAAFERLECRKNHRSLFDGWVASINWNANHKEWEVTMFAGAGKIYRGKTLAEAINKIEEK